MREKRPLKERGREDREVVGTGRFELPTCRLGGDRSIQLSYVPASTIVADSDHATRPEESCPRALLAAHQKNSGVTFSMEEAPFGNLCTPSVSDRLKSVIHQPVYGVDRVPP